MLEDVVNDPNIARAMVHSDTTLPEKKHINNMCLRQWPQEKGRATNLKRLEVRQLSRAGRGNGHAQANATSDYQSCALLCCTLIALMSIIQLYVLHVPGLSVLT